MSVVGNPGQFAPLFPDDFIEDIITRVPVAWDRIPKPISEVLETRITKLLRHQYAYDPVIKQLPFQVRRELPIDDPKSGEELGRIDLCLLHGNDEDTYFAFECKRLNVTFPSGQFAPLSGEYVGTNGMGCFISRQYASGHRLGGMIGYVFDGNIAGAQQAILKIIEATFAVLNMADGELLKSSFLPHDIRLRETDHPRAVPPMRLYHIFLPNH